MSTNQQDMVSRYMRGNTGITGAEAFLVLGVMHLPAVINRIKKDWKLTNPTQIILSEQVRTKTTRYTRYFIYEIGRGRI